MKKLSRKERRRKSKKSKSAQFTEFNGAQHELANSDKSFVDQYFDPGYLSNPFDSKPNKKD